jgi:hypothetical protein
MIREAEMKMRFFRHRRGFACLALVALATQVYLSLGHTHESGVFTRYAGSAVACRTLTPPSVDKSCPPRHSHEHDCPICWTGSIAGSLVLPEQPALAVPVSQSETLKLRPAAELLPAKAAAPFYARGPPYARA